MIKVEGRGHNYGVLHIKVEQSTSLAQILDQLSIVNAQELITLGALYLNNQRLLGWPSQDLQPEDYLRVHSDPRRFPTAQINWQERILFSNDDFVMFHKPHGIPCHPSVDNRLENCLYQLQKHLELPLFITHRLDVATEGLLLFAKTLSAQKYFNDLLLQRLVQKRYTCLTQSFVPEGLKTHYMEISPRAPKIVHLQEQDNTLPCHLNVIKSVPYSSFDPSAKETQGAQKHQLFINEINLLTGRTHQIRAQMAALNAPLLGDKAYGSRQKIKVSSRYNEIPLKDAEAIALCAVSLSFTWSEKEFHFTTQMSEINYSPNE